MAATPVAKDAPPSLSRLFLQGWEARRKIDACELASGSPERAVRESTGCMQVSRPTLFSVYMYDHRDYVFILSMD